MKCSICPRRCGADRENGQLGLCGAPYEITAARAAMHFWEEPCISGRHNGEADCVRGSGTIFFCGCPLGCVFCQNHEISQRKRSIEGVVLSPEKLADIMLRLQDEGAYNINLVTPTHYTVQIRKTLETVKSKLSIPVIWNTGGYELTDTLNTLDGLVDVWLPDIKYMSPEISQRYCRAGDYFEYASKAVKHMYEMSGPIQFDSDGMVKSGVIIRHLVLPSHRTDSMDIIRWIADSFDPETVRVSIMDQYTPISDKSEFTELNRRVTSFEYTSVTDLASELGLLGWTQRKTSVGRTFTPDFDGTGLEI